jgi:hypothetical protein
VVTPPPDGGDVSSLVAFWNDSAGPNHAAGSIPSLLDDRSARKASNDLRTRIPAAIRPSCSPDRNSFERPWVEVEWEWDCDHPSPGVYSAVYTSYRNRAGLDAAFDPDAYAATSTMRNKECPTSSPWKTGGTTRGRYACTVDETSTSISWSLDDALITASARAYDAEMSTKQLIAWWNDKAGPLD